MHKRKLGSTGKEVSILGMGCMRMPVIDGREDQIDEERSIALIRRAIDGGVNYIDTAYPYHGGHSEALVGKALKEGYRERVTLVTKSPVWLVKEEADFDRYLDEQLERLDVDKIDLYLMHALDKKRWKTLKDCQFEDFVKRAKAAGKIDHIGFSFHDDHETFVEILEGYPWEVCMIQFNYMDQAEQAMLKGLKLAGEKKIPVVVMEPLKGGLLAEPPEDILTVLNGGPKKRSAVEWALRWVGQYPEVSVVLSGMSNEEQVDENLAIAKKNTPHNLEEADLERVEEARKTFESRVQVPCTDCKYCMPCPHGVDIPGNFKRINRAFIFDVLPKESTQYQKWDPKKRAAACVACGACEPTCPQQIAIIEELAKVEKTLG